MPTLTPVMRYPLMMLALYLLFATATGDVARAVDPSAACVRVDTARSSCSGTCVASDGKTSLVLTCNHCYSPGVDRDGWSVRGDYPVPVTVTNRDGKKFKGVAVDGLYSGAGDFAVVRVDGAIAVARLAARAPAVGDRVRHWGITSKYAEGKVIRGDDDTALPPWRWQADISSIPGDSGAGLFNDAGELVAVNWGYMRSGRRTVETGTPISVYVQWRDREDWRTLARQEGTRAARP